MVESWQHWEGRIVNGKFPLQRYLDGSQYSVVYLTEVQGAPAAIKLVPDSAPNAQALSSSWKLAGRLSHPNLVRIVETGLWHADDEQDMLFAVMEYCDESLAGVLRERLLTPAETRQMLPPALDALKYLHAQNVVHGQINPSNILAVGDRLKLSSDGVRSTADPDYPQLASPYDPPEKTTGVISPSGDIWSLGVTVIEVLTNRLPGRDQNGHPELTEKLPAPFDAITKGCLALDPARRFSISEIHDLLEGRPAKQARAEIKALPVAEKKADAKPEAVSPQDPRKAPAYVSSAAAAYSSASTGRNEGPESSAVASKRRLVLIAAAVVVILAIAFGLRLLHNRSDTPQATVARVAPQESTSSASGTSATTSIPSAATGGVTGAAKTPSSSNGSGTVLHQVMPEVSGPARKSIHGTLKVKVQVAVDTQGKVSQATAAGRPSKYFASQSLQAARQWTFDPPVQDGKPQASAWNLQFEFTKRGTQATARRSRP